VPDVDALMDRAFGASS